jgi:glycosyltransferase involved in cell wall biosynthesis
MPTPLPVTLDAGPALHQRAGLSRYTERLAASLYQHCADRVALILFYNQHSGHQLPSSLRVLPTQPMKLGQYAWRLSVLVSQLAALPYFPLQQRLRGTSLYHATEHLLPRLNIPTVMTVHDLIFERYPQHHKITNRAFLRVGMPLFVRAATHIIAVSRHTADDLNSLYQVPAAKIEVIYEGVDAEFQPASAAQVEAIRARYSPDRPFLLMVGTLEPRKNHLLALKALAQLKAEGYPHRLVIAGGKGWLFEPIAAKVDEMGLTNDVIFSGYVPGEDLPGLYSASTCLLLPSQYEGFGLPLLEAMACGAPVVSSNASSLPELAGDAALLVSPDDEAAFLNAVRQIIDRPELAATLVERGFKQAGKFSWEAAAQKTAQLYHHVVQR